MSTPANSQSDQPQSHDADVWQQLTDVELRGQWFLDTDSDEMVECRGFLGGRVRFRTLRGERLELPRETAKETLRPVRGPTDPRPPSQEQLPERIH